MTNPGIRRASLFLEEEGVRQVLPAYFYGRKDIFFFNSSRGLGFFYDRRIGVGARRPRCRPLFPVGHRIQGKFHTGGFFFVRSRYGVGFSRQGERSACRLEDIGQERKEQGGQVRLEQIQGNRQERFANI